MQTLYEKISPDLIERAITEFYERAFSDVIIGHFFFDKDKQEIIDKQIAFASRMLGATHIRYTGKPLKIAHEGLKFRPVHFNRRQVLMAEVLDDIKLDPELSSEWLALESHLRPLILHSASSSSEK